MSPVFMMLLSLSAMSSAVLLRDPKRYPCEDYDLFDPPQRILRVGSGENVEENHEDLAHKVVTQLNMRSNSMFKSLLIQLSHARTEQSGRTLLTFYQAETRCRNNGQHSTSLIECPYREKGLVQKCSATLRIEPQMTTHSVKIDEVSCKLSHLGEVMRLSSNGNLQELDSGDVMTWMKTPLTGFREATQDNFKCFVLRHGKSYATDEERQQRFQQFQANMKRAYFYQITEQGTGVYGPTKFSDLSVEEFRTTATGLKPTKATTKMHKAKIPTGDVPEEFDWRNKSAVTPVKDQGQCGSCWAFSTTGNIEGQWAIKKGKLISLSEQELVDCDKYDEGCGGGLPSNAYKAVIEVGGIETEEDYPYHGRNQQCTFKKPMAKVYINDSVNITQSETEMAQWLVQNGPISIGINANAMMLYLGGVSHPWKVLCSPNNLDHGVLIVGFGKQGKNPYWIVKNSWGTGWGVKGYYLVYRGDGTCGLNLMCTSSIVL